MYSIQLGE